MANEAAKAYPRLKGLLVGKGIDIGCGATPVTPDCDRWDVDHGDAQLMIGAPRDYYDWVFTSHLIEHVRNPYVAIRAWWRLVKPGGVLIVLAPDEDLYEKGVWPSQHNGDHKHTFTLSKLDSWSPASVNMVDLMGGLPDHRLVDLSLQDNGYDYSKVDDTEDQTGGSAEASIQMILRKNPSAPVHNSFPIKCTFTSPDGTSKVTNMRGTHVIEQK